MLGVGHTRFKSAITHADDANPFQNDCEHGHLVPELSLYRAKLSHTLHSLTISFDDKKHDNGNYSTQFSFRKYKLHCGSGGQWYGPRCIPVSCSVPNKVYSGLYNCTNDFKYGSICAMNCPGQKAKVSFFFLILFIQIL